MFQFWALQSIVTLSRLINQPSSVIITPPQNTFVVDYNSILISLRMGIPFQNYGQLNVVNTQL